MNIKKTLNIYITFFLFFKKKKIFKDTGLVHWTSKLFLGGGKDTFSV